MRLIERYLFRQLFGPTLLAVAALGAVAFLSQSLSNLEIIVDQRQSALVFIKLTLLATPQLLNMIMPVAVFVAALSVLNRMQTDQELVVMAAGGMSRWRMVSPAVRLALGAVLVGLIMNLWIQPMTYRAIRSITYQARSDLASTLVRAGEFSQPSDGLTVYAKSVDHDGLIHDLFIHQDGDSKAANAKSGDGSSTSATTYNAREGRIAKRNGQPVLIMRQGSNQSFTSGGVLNYLSFDEYIFPLSPFLKVDSRVRYKQSDRFMHELFYPDLSQEWERKNQNKMLAEGHARLSTPLYNLTFMAMALAAVLGAPFSRLGYGGRIAMVGAAAALVRIVGFGVQAACDDEMWLNVLQYVVPLAGMAWGFWSIFRPRAGTSGAPRPAPALSAAT
jgi:lipopolysaccharide export system permease protein